MVKVHYRGATGAKSKPAGVISRSYLALRFETEDLNILKQKKHALKEKKGKNMQYTCGYYIQFILCTQVGLCRPEYLNTNKTCTKEEKRGGMQCTCWHYMQPIFGTLLGHCGLEYLNIKIINCNQKN